MLNDPRMHRLMKTRLSSKMKAVLELCGYDLFVALILMADHFSVDYEKGNTIRFPPPSILEKISRDDYIFTLHNEEGMSTKEIHSRLSRGHGIKIGIRQISRIIDKLRPASY